MTTRAVERVDDWTSRPYSGGYRGLHDLAEDEFSGIVAAGSTRLCMTSGRVTGILDGTIEDFEDASGTAYEAPSQALSLLSVMQERSDEVRAQYYTEETSIEEVDRTLTEGNFTGYVELSENVLSGDYYLIYHQGRSMSAAWVGASENLLIEDEAFDRANDEVGIYEVRPVGIEAIEIPEPAEPTTGETTAETGETTAAAANADTESEATGVEPAETEATAEPATADDEGGAEAAEVDMAVDSVRDGEASDPAATESEPTQAEAGATGEADAVNRSTSESMSSPAGSGERTNGEAVGDTTEAEAHDENTKTDERTRGVTEQRESSGSQRNGGRAESAGTERQRGRADRETASQSSEPQSRQQQPSAQEPAGSEPAAKRDAGPRGAGGAGASGSRSGAAGPDHRREAGQSNADDVGGPETNSIPSLDPGQTSESDGGDGQQRPTTAARSSTRSESKPGPAGGSESKPRRGSEPPNQGTEPTPRRGTPQRERDTAQPERSPADRQQNEPRREPTDPEREPEPPESSEASNIESLRAELDAREAEAEDLKAKLETVKKERDELAAERDELRERLEQLERRIDELRTGESDESVADRERLSPAEAIEGTNLFIRYASKGDATLEAAHAGNAKPSAVNDNMQIQFHTQFEADDVAVNGKPFATYLTETTQYSFVEWLVRVLPYEIRDTGHREALGPLYNALPRIDRAELNGVIAVQYQEDGEEQRSQESFDVVLRDRMGNPLIVANMNEGRQPASQSMMRGLISASQRVGECKGSLAGTFLVTSSFFEPEGMETASDATGSGLLSRDKRKSFVKLSRKDGFHLCLVEAREENFNLSVPEI